MLGVSGACIAGLAAPSALAQTQSNAVAPSVEGASEPSAALASDAATALSTTSYPRVFFGPFSPATALDMVMRVPGFRLREGAAVRGLSGSFGNVLIDGREHASKSESLKTALSRIPADWVESIELVAPASSDLARDGYNLIANVRRRPDARRSAAITLVGHASPDGGGGQVAVEGNLRSGPNDLSGAARAYDGRSRWSDGRYALMATGAPAFDGALSEDGRDRGQRLQGRIDRERLGLALDLSNDRGASRSQVRSRTSQLRELFESRWRSQKAETTLDVSQQLTPDLGAKAVLLHSVAQTEYDDLYATPGFEARAGYVDETTETIGRFILTPGHAGDWTWVGGLELARNTLDGASSYLVSGLAVPLPAQDVEVGETRGEVFLRLKGPLAAHWRMDAALAYERSRLRQKGGVRTSVNFEDVRPELALTYTPDPKTQVSLSLGRKVGQLDFSDFITSVALRDQVIEVGNSGLEPERRWRMEAAYHHTFLERGAVTLTVGHDVIDNPIEFIPLAGRDSPGNLDQARVTYVNLTASAPLDPLGVDGGVLRIDASHRRSSVRDPVTGARRRLEGEVENSAYLELRQDLPGRAWSWAVDVQAYSGSRSYRRALLTHYESQPAMGAEVEYRPSKPWRLKLRVESGDRSETTQVRYAGTRASGQIVSVEMREPRPGPTVYLTLRRSL